MKRSVWLLAAVPAVCVCVSVGLLCRLQKDKTSIPVQLETLQGDAALLDGVRIEGELFNNVDGSFHGAGGGVWKQTVTFENGQPRVENSFSPEQREFRYTGYRLPSQLPVGVDNSANGENQNRLETLQKGEYRLAALVPQWERNGCRFLESDDFLLPVGSVWFGEGAVLEIPVPADAVLTVEEGDLEGQPYKRATYPQVYLPEIYAQGVRLSDGMLFTLPDAGLMDLRWEPSQTVFTNQTQDGRWSSIAGGGVSDGDQAAPEELPPADYTLHSGVFFLAGEQESETETAARLFSLDCTRAGDHILGMCRLTDSRAALLTIENGWYSVRLVSVPGGAVSDAVPLQPWNGEAVNEAQLQVQDGMLLARLNVTADSNMRNWFFAADCTGQPSLKLWYTDTSGWDDGWKASSFSRWELLWQGGNLLAANLQPGVVHLVLLDRSGVACRSNLYSYSNMPMLRVPVDHEKLAQWDAVPLQWDVDTMKVGVA